MARGPGKAAVVVLRDGPLELGAVVLGRPALERVEDGDPDARATLVGWDERDSDRTVGRRVPVDERVAAADRLVVALGEQPDHVARLLAPVDEAGNGRMLARLRGEGDRHKVVQLVLLDLANSQHAATLCSEHTYGGDLVSTWSIRR